MSFLLVTVPVTLLVSAALLVLVLRAAREGQYDDWEGPAWRMLHDDDREPEREGDLRTTEASETPDPDPEATRQPPP